MATAVEWLFKKIPTKIDCLISGYIKKEEAEYGIKIPYEIIQIFCVYYCTPFKFHMHHDDKLPTSEPPSTGTVITNNEQTVSNVSLSVRSYDYPTIRFGDYLTQKDSYCTFKFAFLTELAKSGHIGIGFITNEFKEFHHNNFNYGKNHSMILWSTSGGYFVTSDEFDSTQQKYHKHSLRDENGKKCARHLLEEKSNVIVEIDMKARTAQITNMKNKSCFKTKNLPDNVALAFAFGQHEKGKITCIKQEFM